jgi:hypothetical protein
MKKFSICDSLQETIRDIQFARSKLPLPELIPTSRKELDLMLLEAKYTLDHTVTVHDLVLCGKLELRIQQLELNKDIFLTVEERQISLKAAVAALDDAMTRKEFKKCAQLQQVHTTITAITVITVVCTDHTVFLCVQSIILSFIFHSKASELF